MRAPLDAAALRFAGRTVAAAALVVASVVFPGAGRSGAQAPDAPGAAALSVSPAIIDNTLQPGQSFVADITLGNVSDQPTAVAALVSSFVPEQRIDPAFSHVYDASSWFTFDSAEVVLPPREQRVIPFRVTVPENAEPGGHYATIYFEAARGGPADGTAGTAVSARVGVLVLMTVLGEIREELDAVTPVQVDRLHTDDRSSFRFTIRNGGSVHQAPVARLTIESIFGGEVEELDVETGVILPHTEREFAVEWGHGFRVGGYRAGATVTGGSQAQLTVPVAESWFVIAPSAFIAVTAVAVALIVLLLVVRGRRRRARRRQRRQEVQRAVLALKDDESSQPPA